MDEFEESNFYTNSYNSNDYMDYSNNYLLKNSLNYNNYRNKRNNLYDNNFQDLMINNNINNSQESISLIQIKNDLDLLNNKMNIISEALHNLNLFNFIPKNKIINLKKNNSMINKNIKNNKYNSNNMNNIKHGRNNSFVGLNTNKINKYTFDDNLGVNNFMEDNHTFIENKNYGNNNNVKNSYFGLYDKYFMESLSNNKSKVEEKIIENNHENTQDIILNQNKNINKYNNIFNKKTNKKVNNIKIKSSDINKINNKYKLNNQNNKNESNNKQKQKKDKTQLNKTNKESLVENKEEKLNTLKVTKRNTATNKIIKNTKRKKSLSFHEEDNVTIEYNKKDEITKIEAFDFFGENQNFQPRNANVIIEKLKRKKSKTKPILINKNNPIKISNEKSNEIRQLKKSNSVISIVSNREKQLLIKHKSKKGNSGNKDKNKNYFKKKSKICEKFRNNPQLFYGEELCDLVIKSFDTNGDCLKRWNEQSRNTNKKIELNNIYNRNENMTMDMNMDRMKYLQRIDEEIE